MVTSNILTDLLNEIVFLFNRLMCSLKFRLPLSILLFLYIVVSTDRHKPTDNAIFGKAVWLSLRKIKRAAKPPTSRPTFAAHFILPYRTSTNRKFLAQPTIFFPTFAP